jgi:hypothetical protein
VGRWLANHRADLLVIKLPSASRAGIIIATRREQE